MTRPFTNLVEGLRSGEDQAVRAFCDRYGVALERLANKHMAPGLMARVGSEDVVQSVYRTFFRRAAEGQFVFGDDQDLWRLLCVITLTKVREKARYHLRQKRGFDREQPLQDSPEPQLSEPGPDEQAAFVEQFEHILASLDDEERRVVELKLLGRSHPEIAEELACSERTVRRMLARMRQRFDALTS